MTRISRVNKFYNNQKHSLMHPRWTLDLYEEVEVPHGSESFSEILKSKM